MIQTIKNAWKIPDLRQRITFTLLMLVVFRLGSMIPVPGFNRDLLAGIVGEGGLLDMFNMFSGGAFGQMTIFALSITPYITASIIMNLLTIAIPSLEQLSKEGETGKKKMAQYTRYGTIVLALIQATGITLGLFRNALIDTGFFNVFVVIITLTAGTAFLMWLGEQITDKGIGNGISLIIFAGIISMLPSQIMSNINLYRADEIGLLPIIIFAIVAVVIIAGIIFITEGKRKIPVQYAKRVVGRKMYGGQSSHIPLKVNQSGVIPVIFAMSLLAFPQTIALFFGQDSWIANFVHNWFSAGNTLHGSIIYILVSSALIVFFAYFYTAVTFNPVDVANNMKKQGGFIPGIRPGKPTVDYLSKVLSRLTLVGGLFLAVIASMPIMIQASTGLQIAFGGTSLLIAVGVALETMKQIEAQMLMRNYEGFLK